METIGYCIQYLMTACFLIGAKITPFVALVLLIWKLARSYIQNHEKEPFVLEK